MKAAINTEYKGKLAITDLPIPEVLDQNKKATKR